MKRVVSFLWPFVLVLGLWVLWVLVLNRRPEIQDIRGDFGALEALFTGLAFAGFLVALRYQRQELEMQREDLKQTRKELKLTRDEIAGQRGQMEAQNETLRLQRFETTFFNLLSQHHGLVAGISIETTMGGAIVTDDTPGVFQRMQVTGRTALRKLQEQLMGQMINSMEQQGLDAELVVITYRAFEEKWGVLLDHYLRNLRGIFYFIEEYDSPRQPVYARLTCAQLSAPEAGILFYHGFLSRDWKGLAERVGLFNNLPEQMIVEPALRKYYAKSAYERPVVYAPSI